MTPHALRLAFLTLLLVVPAGCGDDDVPATDGGPADAGTVDGGHDAAIPEDATVVEDAATPEDAAHPEDAGTPPDTAPYCGAIGSFSEGWYQPDGTLICYAMCAGAVVACENVGTRSEGWYTVLPGAACTTPMAPNLVQWANCAP